MPDRQYRVAPDHPGAGITHDAPDLFPPVPPVTVNGAVGAGWLILPVPAPVNPPYGIVKQFPALIAESVFSLAPVGVITMAE